MSWLFLFLAILLEVAGTVCMKLSEGFTRWPYAVLMFLFYAVAFTSLTFALKSIDVSIAYAIWAGLGVALIALIGILLFKEPVTLPKMFALTLIIVGVMMLNFTGSNH